MKTSPWKNGGLKGSSGEVIKEKNKGKGNASPREFQQFCIQADHYWGFK